MGYNARYELKVKELGPMTPPPQNTSLAELRKYAKALKIIYPQAKTKAFSQSGSPDGGIVIKEVKAVI
jgi:hypothetical protein